MSLLRYSTIGRVLARLRAQLMSRRHAKTLDSVPIATA